MRLGYARHAQQQGLVAWRTPRVVPWGTWLRNQYLEARVAASPDAARSRVLTPTQARILWDDVVANSRAARELLNPSHAARLAARSWRRLHDYLIPTERLAAFDTHETQALHAWCSEFSRRCASLGAIDEARLSHWAYDSELVPQERVACAGFDAMPPAMSRLLDRWRARELVADIESAARETSEVAIVAADDAVAELDLAAQWSRDRVLAGAGEVGVILPDLAARRDEVRRVFEDVFTPGARQISSGTSAVPVVIAAPSPMSDYPMVDAALLVLQLAARECPSTDAGRILRSPFIVGGHTERAHRALADRRLREEQRDRWNWFELERWAALTRCEQLLIAARELNAIVRGLGSALASEWTESFHRMWQAVGWPGDRT
ncbi:MAG: hypothetical protein ACREUC_05545, partial [Steroidobacteraceae bacterium]